MNENFLFRGFHRVVEGDLNPFDHNEISYSEELNDYRHRGRKMIVYRHLTYDKVNGKYQYRDCMEYWCKHYWKIVPHADKRTITKGIDITAFFPFSIAMNEGEELINAYQRFDDKVELVVEQNVETLDNITSRLHYYNLLFQIETEHIQDYLLSQVYQKKKRVAREQLVSDMMQVICHYKSKIQGLFEISDANWHHSFAPYQNETNIFKLLYQYLDYISLHIYEDYKAYLKPLQLANDFITAHIFQNRAKECSYIESCLQKEIVNPELVNITRQLLNAVNAPVTYYSLNKWEAIVLRIYDLFEQHNTQPRGLLDQWLLDIYVKEGVNFTSLAHFFIRQFNEELKTLSHEQRIKLLKGKVNQYRKSEHLTKEKFNPLIPDLFEQITDWLAYRIDQYQAKPFLPSNHEKNKYLLKSSVSEIAVLIRGFLDAGLLVTEGETLREFALKVSDVVATPNMQEISGHSLYNKTVSLDHKSIASVQDKLLDVHATLEALKE